MELDKKKFIKGVKRTLVYGSYVFTIVAGLVAVWAFFFPNTVGNALQSLLESNEEIAETSREIADNTAGAKREVSDDPVIQLSNRGYSLSRDEFIRALEISDTTSIQLFCDTGTTLIRSPQFFYAAWDGDADISPYPETSIKALSNCRALDLKSICRGDTKRPIEKLREYDFLVVCGRSALRRLEAERAEAVEAKEEQKHAELLEHCNERLEKFVSMADHIASEARGSEPSQWDVAKLQNAWNVYTSRQNVSFCKTRFDIDIWAEGQKRFLSHF